MSEPIISHEVLIERIKKYLSEHYDESKPYLVINTRNEIPEAEFLGTMKYCVSGFANCYRIKYSDVTDDILNKIFTEDSYPARISFDTEDGKDKMGGKTPILGTVSELFTDDEKFDYLHDYFFGDSDKWKYHPTDEELELVKNKLSPEFFNSGILFYDKNENCLDIKYPMATASRWWRLNLDTNDIELIGMS